MRKVILSTFQEIMAEGFPILLKDQSLDSRIPIKPKDI